MTRHGQTGGSDPTSTGWWDDAYVDSLPIAKRVRLLETGSTFKPPKAVDKVWPPPSSDAGSTVPARGSMSRLRNRGDVARPHPLDVDLQHAKIDYLRAKTERQRHMMGKRVRRRRHKRSFFASIVYWLIGIPCCFLWATPFVLAGALCMMTIIGVPVGLALWGIGGWPLSWLIARRIR